MKKTYIIVLSVLGLFITVTGIAFAFFYATNNDSDVGVSGAAKEINTVEYIPGTSLIIPESGIYPGWIGVQDFQVVVPDGITSGTGTYEIVLETNIHEDYSDWITYELYKTTDMGNTITRVEGTLNDDVYNLYVDDSLVSNGFTIPDDAEASGIANNTSGDISVDKVSYDLSTFEDTKYYLVIRFLNEDLNQNAAINKYFEITIKMKQVVAGEGYKDPVIAGNDPVLDSKLIPVIIEEGTGTVTIADTSKEWYNYGSKEWANAVLVDPTFTTLDPGTVIPMESVEQMYVWIPRYEYSKSSIETPTEAIDVTFVGIDKTSTTSQVENDDIIVHPAFCWGNYCQTDRSHADNIEIPGFWIHKFEILEDNGVVVKPNQVLEPIENFEFTFGSWTDSVASLSVDEHTVKNTEWGAVAYLSQSQYGICFADGTCIEEINAEGVLLVEEKTVLGNGYYYDNSGTGIRNFISGCGGRNTIYRTYSSGINICYASNRWTTELGTSSSTNHNITGIYDMAGGFSELVSSAMYDYFGELKYGYTAAAEGVFPNIEAKYVDAYNERNLMEGSVCDSYNPIDRLYGDGLLVSWSDSDNYNFVCASTPILSRGYLDISNSTLNIWTFRGDVFEWIDHETVAIPNSYTSRNVLVMY